jgi:hypothetical protein
MYVTARQEGVRSLSSEVLAFETVRHAYCRYMGE